MYNNNCLYHSFNVQYLPIIHVFQSDSQKAPKINPCVDKILWFVLLRKPKVIRLEIINNPTICDSLSSEKSS